jgi:hypothetical protein
MQARYGAAAARPLRGVTPDARQPDLHHIWIGGERGLVKCVAGPSDVMSGPHSRGRWAGMQRVRTLQAADYRCMSASASALRIRSAPRARAGGTQKHKTLSHAYRSAPRVQPTAKAKTLIVIWVSRSLLAFIFSGANPFQVPQADCRAVTARNPALSLQARQALRINA